MSITGSARLAGVIGWPIAHSLSPQLHGYWIGQHGLDAVYVPLAIRKEDFATALHGLRAAGFRGVNVTVPHKEAAFALADRCDGAALMAGAANLLLFSDHGIEARNTDPAGLSAALCEALGEDAVKGQVAAVLGAGGMARSAVCALSELGASEIRIFNRNIARADSLAGALAPKLRARLTVFGFDRWAEGGKDVTLVVHATSAGMKGAESLDLPLEILPKDTVVFDAVYNPLRTGLLARAELCGLRTMDGLGMLMHQAVPAFAAFFGIEPKVSPALRNTLEEALRRGR